MRGLWLVGCVLAPGVVWACGSEVFGIPGECRMHVYEVTPGAVAAPAGAAASIAELSSEVMRERWAQRAFVPSPDGRRLVIHRRDGLELRAGDQGRPGTRLALDLLAHCPRDVAWAPDSTRLALWAPGAGKRVAMLDADRPLASQATLYDPTQLGALPGGAQLLRPGETREVTRFAWSPDGDALYVVERTSAEGQVTGGVILRLELDGQRITEARELVRCEEPIDVVQPSASLVMGDGTPGHWVLASAPSGVYLVDSRGKAAPQRIPNLPGEGLFDVAWHPSEDMALLDYRLGRTDLGGRGQEARGLWLLHVSRIGAAGQTALEQLYERIDLHTVGWSPGGRYATWSGGDEVAYRRPQAPPETTVFVDSVTAAGEYRQLRGVSWDPDEQRLAITADDCLLLHQVGVPGAQELARFGSPEDRALWFVAEPCWVGERILLTGFEDLTGDAR